MKPFYQDKWVTIYHGDCREILPQLDDASAIVTDPPYEFGFMGKSWDSKGVSLQRETWQIIRNACKSGSPLLAFGGTRTFHRIAVAIEDAGWEIRDTLMWVYGSGFPKSLDISKKIEGVTGKQSRGFNTAGGKENFDKQDKSFRSDYGYQWQPATPEAQLWNGYGTALKPAYEPIILAMNPLDGTFAQNALKCGVAGLNIDGCRIGTNDNLNGGFYRDSPDEYQAVCYGKHKRGGEYQQPKGRFPANFIHDGSQQVMELFPESGISRGGNSGVLSNSVYGKYDTVKNNDGCGFNDSGSAARFFYCAKASKAERNKGCDDLAERNVSHDGREKHIENPYQRHDNIQSNNHPTVKPLALMEYLCRLVTYPARNLIIDPFMGSGTTLLACIKLGIPCIGIDSDEKSCEIAAKRCSQEVMELNV